MSERKGSFWSTIPGFVTGLAGLLTGIVGIVTVLIQLDVIGGNGSNGTGTTTTTVAGAAPGGGAGGAGSSDTVRLSVNPAALDFAAGGPPEKAVTVRNESDRSTLRVSTRVEGDDRAQFSATSGTCSAPLAPGERCTLQVSFTPSGPLRRYNATLVVAAPGARAEEIRLTASTLL